MARFVKIHQNRIWLNKTFCDLRKPGPGAPEKPYILSSKRSQYRKTRSVYNELVKNSPNRTMAAAKQYVLSNNICSPKSLNFSDIEVTETKIKNLNVSDSFDILVGGRFSKREYINLTHILKEKDIFLKSYETIRTNILKDCKDDLPIVAEPSLVYISPHTAFSHSFHQILDGLNLPFTDKKYKFYCKFGFDGGETQQQINFDNESPKINDKHFFIVTFLPLFIFLDDEKIWQNTNPNSVNQCKPLEIHFCKENDKLSLSIFQKFTNLCKNTEFDLFDLNLIPSMMDQKAINACTIFQPPNKGSDTKKCYICKLRSVGKNSFQNIRASSSNTSCEILHFGLSNLHALLNFTKFIIYDVAAVINKKSKIEINNDLSSVYNIDFAEVRRGFGSQITGNIARNFYKDCNKFASALNIDYSFVENVNIFLKMLRSSEPINYEQFSLIITNIFEFLDKNSIHLTPTVHKLLIHSNEITKYFYDFFGVGPGFFSEEPMESMIRKARKIREENTRMVSRIDNNYDLLVYCYIFST